MLLRISGFNQRVHTAPLPKEHNQNRHGRKNLPSPYTHRCWPDALEIGPPVFTAMAELGKVLCRLMDAVHSFVLQSVIVDAAVKATVQHGVARPR